MSKAVAKKLESVSNAIQAVQPAAGSTYEQATATDIRIPKILLMQAISTLVNEEKAQKGDLVNQISGEVIGNEKKPLSFIPLTYYKSWIVQEKIGNKFEYRRQEERNASNENFPWEWEEAGTTWKRVKAINVYALLADQAKAYAADLKNALDKGEMPDPSKAVLPVLISFRSTSLGGGQDIITHFSSMEDYRKQGFPNIQGFMTAFELQCKKTSNDKGTWYVMAVKRLGSTPKELLPLADTWRTRIVSGATNLKVEESEDSETTDTRDAEY